MFHAIHYLQLTSLWYSAMIQLVGKRIFSHNLSTKDEYGRATRSNNIGLRKLPAEIGLSSQTARSASLCYSNATYKQGTVLVCDLPDLSVVADKGLELLSTTDAVSVALGLLSSITLAVWLVEEVAQPAPRLVALRNGETYHIGSCSSCPCRCTGRWLKSRQPLTGSCSKLSRCNN